MWGNPQPLIAWSGVLVLVTIQTVSAAAVDSEHHCQDIDGGWNVWHPWGPCDCEDTRMRSRERECKNPEPSGRGKSCCGSIKETTDCSRDCEDLPCWDAWGVWSDCNCAAGDNAQKSRSRPCRKSETTKKDCYRHGIGETQTKPCLSECSTAQWGQWSTWGQCNQTGVMTQSRKRECIVEANDENCHGISFEARSCIAVDGQWNIWGLWGDCICVADGPSIRNRVRHCNNPEPSKGGFYCAGSGKDTEDCEDDDTCIQTTTFEPPTNTSPSRRRLLSDVMEESHDDTEKEYVHSNRQLLWDKDNCPVDGHWTEWGDWGKCKCSGNIGIESRKRYCDDPAPSDCGKKCQGQSSEHRTCDAGGCGNPVEVCEFCDYTDNIGYYRHPVECDVFYECTRTKRGKKYTYSVTNKTCAEGTVFSNQMLGCAWPKAVPQDDHCYNDDPCTDSSIEIRAYAESCTGYECWSKGNLAWLFCCDIGYRFSLGDRACVPITDGDECEPSGLCIPPPQLGDDDPLGGNDRVNLGDCVQNGVWYKAGRKENKYIIAATGNQLSCPENMIFNASPDVCACQNAGDAPLKVCQRAEAYLIGYWPFDTDFNDHSCNKITGIVDGKVNLVKNCLDGRGCVKFINGRIDISFFLNWFDSIVPEFSIALWIKVSKVSKQKQSILHNGNCASNPSVQLEIHAGNNLFAQFNQFNNMTEVALPLDEWVHVVMVFDNGLVTLYINGEVAGSYQTVGTIIVDTNCLLRLGKVGDKAKFQGLIDEVMIYKEALTPSYINEIYNFRTVDWYKTIYYG